MRNEEEENELTRKCKHPPEKVTKPKNKSRETDTLLVLFLKTGLNCLTVTQKPWRKLPAWLHSRSEISKISLPSSASPAAERDSLIPGALSRLGMQSPCELMGQNLLSQCLANDVPPGASGFALTYCPVLLQNLRGRGSSHQEVAGSRDEGLYLLFRQRRSPEASVWILYRR